MKPYSMSLFFFVMVFKSISADIFPMSIAGCTIALNLGLNNWAKGAFVNPTIFTSEARGSGSL